MSTIGLIFFALATAGLAFTPGPNTALTISRTMSQGRRAGFMVLFGVEMGFFVHLCAAAVGVTALLLSVPTLYAAVRAAGCIYLLYVAWKIGSGSRQLFRADALEREGDLRLIGMGFLSNALNPKTTAFYLSVFPQFIDLRSGSILFKSFELGILHITVSTMCNSCYVVGAGSLAAWLNEHPAWDRVQRWFLGGVIAAFAVGLALEKQ